MDAGTMPARFPALEIQATAGTLVTATDAPTRGLVNDREQSFSKRKPNHNEEQNHAGHLAPTLL
jgi:hypothetical protein